MPTTEIKPGDFEKAPTITDILVKTGLASSRGDARRLVEQGGISVDDNKITSPFAEITDEMTAKGYIIVKKGKKIYHKVRF